MAIMSIIVRDMATVIVGNGNGTFHRLEIVRLYVKGNQGNGHGNSPQW